MLFLFHGIVRVAFVDYELDHTKPAWLNFIKLREEVETSLHFGVYYIADVVQQQRVWEWRTWYSLPNMRSSIQMCRRVLAETLAERGGNKIM